MYRGIQTKTMANILALTMKERLEFIGTFIIAIALILFAMPLVVKVDNDLFSVWIAFLIGAWIYMMYRRFL